MPEGAARRPGWRALLPAASPWPYGFMASPEPVGVVEPFPAENYTPFLLSIVTMLGLVLLLWLAARYLQGRAAGVPAGAGRLRLGGAGLIRVEARQYLDQQRALFIVQVEGRRFLVGGANEGLSLLAELEPAPEGGEVPETDAEPAPQAPFIAHLASLLRQRRQGEPPQDRS